MDDARRRFYNEYRYWRKYLKIAWRIEDEAARRNDYKLPPAYIAARWCGVTTDEARRALSLINPDSWERQPAPPRFAGWFKPKNRSKAVCDRVSLYCGCCWICGKPGAWSVDHVKPRTKGGSQLPANIRPAHRRCNLLKSNKWPYRVRPNFGRPVPL